MVAPAVGANGVVNFNNGAQGWVYTENQLDANGNNGSV